MRKMRFKGFTFPHNPYKIEILSPSGTRSVLLPGLGEITQSLGSRCRIITGEGSFYGSYALEQCRKLQELQHQESAGYLYLPHTEPIKAYFTQLNLLCVGDGQLYTYRFEFVEEDAALSKGGMSDADSAIFGYNP